MGNVLALHGDKRIMYIVRKLFPAEILHIYRKPVSELVRLVGTGIARGFHVKSRSAEAQGQYYHAAQSALSRSSGAKPFRRLLPHGEPCYLRRHSSALCGYQHRKGHCIGHQPEVQAQLGQWHRCQQKKYDVWSFNAPAHQQAYYGYCHRKGAVKALEPHILIYFIWSKDGRFRKLFEKAAHKVIDGVHISRNDHITVEKHIKEYNKARSQQQRP